jgi:serine-type D-Ala-D-Ala carboxypeptidase/endopeptidase (penicillin-binding protein 4)
MIKLITKSTIVKFTLLSLIMIFPNIVFSSPKKRLRLRINKLMKTSKVPGKKAVYAKWLNGKTIYSWHPNKALIPASCIKILSTGTALRHFGKNYQFTTKFSGKINGDSLTTPLYWWSNGDPSVNRGNLAKMVVALKKSGVRKIPKGIILDNNYFHRGKPMGFRKNSSSSAYLVSPSPLAVDNNLITVTIKQEDDKIKVTCEPPSIYLKCSNRVVFSNRKNRYVYLVKTYKNKKIVISARGRFKKGSKKIIVKRIKIDRTIRHLSGVLLSLLIEHGISVKKKFKKGNIPKNIPVIATHKSQRFDKIVALTNKHSNNFYAENILRALGAYKFGTPGSTTKGLKLVYKLLRRAGVKTKYIRISNGSGLFGKSRISPKNLVKTMQHFNSLPWLHKSVMESLARPGLDGTLHKRLKGSSAESVLYAKTGTLRNVSCLAGYLKKGKKIILFAVINNKLNGNVRKARRLQNEIVITLARFLKGLKIKLKIPKI